MPDRDIRFLDMGDAWREDERGFVCFLFQHLEPTAPAREVCASCHLISILPGQVRGQHQHPLKTEWLYVFQGQGEFFWRPQGDQVRQRRLSGNRTLVVIPPGIPHALRNDGPDPLYLLAWRAALQPGGEGADTVPETLI